MFIEEDFILPTTKRNRIAKRKPKSGFGYCECDRALLSVGQKCPVCGCIFGRRTNKAHEDIQF